MMMSATACEQFNRPAAALVGTVHSVVVNLLLRYNHRVAMTNRPPHQPRAELNEQLVVFLD